MNVFLLGAGASKCYSQSPAKVRMPIAKDFFQTFNNLEISGNPWVLIGDIINIAKRDWGIEFADFCNSATNIEEFHSYVEEKLLESLPNWPEQGIQYWKSYNQLILLCRKDSI